MKATYYEKRASVKVGDFPEPKIIEATDVIVKVSLAGICGADLEFTQNGPEIGLKPGTRLGHEFVGEIVQVGKGVKRFRIGDRVVASGMFVDGDCFNCKRNQHAACEQGGLFGSHLFEAHGGSEVQGGQSELVRVPFGDGTLFNIPQNLSAPEHDARVLPLGDNFATGYHGATMADIRTGETVVVIGDGAVGLSTVMAATLYGPGQIILVGRHEDRLEIGIKCGATSVINSSKIDAVESVRQKTSGRGAESLIDTVGSKSSINQTLEMARAGASVSIIGLSHLYETTDPPYPASLFRNLRIHTGIVPSGAYFDKLMPLVDSGRIDPSLIFTTELDLSEAEKGYELMRNRTSGTLKVALRV